MAVSYSHLIHLLGHIHFVDLSRLMLVVSGPHSMVDSIRATYFENYPVRLYEFVVVNIAVSNQPHTSLMAHLGNDLPAAVPHFDVVLLLALLIADFEVAMADFDTTSAKTEHRINKLSHDGRT